jgi:SAM-dependent methyltransferase
MSDPIRVVAEGYDRMHDRYVAWSSVHGERRRHEVDWLFDSGLLEARDRVLDLGCGTGQTVTAYLIDRGVDVLGVDISAESIRAARALFPHATFMTAEMTELKWPAAGFKAVTAFYSVIHVPRDRHAQLFKDVFGWLMPGGVFVASLGVQAIDGFAEDWLGVRMYWSHWDAETTTALLEAAGFTILSATVETEFEDGRDVPFLWIRAGKPA